MTVRLATISVGEPWDFKSSDGDNVLHCQLIDVAKGQVEVRALTTPFAIKGATWTEVFLGSRYEGQERWVESVLAGGRETVNVFGEPGRSLILLVGSVSLR